MESKITWKIEWPKSWSRYAMCKLTGEYNGKTYSRQLPRMYFDADREKKEILSEIQKNT